MNKLLIFLSVLSFFTISAIGLSDDISNERNMYIELIYQKINYIKKFNEIKEENAKQLAEKDKIIEELKKQLNDQQKKLEEAEANNEILNKELIKIIQSNNDMNTQNQTLQNMLSSVLANISTELYQMKNKIEQSEKICK